MTNDNVAPATLELGEAIYVPEWNTNGIVTAVGPAMFGDDDSRDVTVSIDPETDEEETFRLTTGDFWLV